MTPEQIIEMAKQAGFHFHDAGSGPEILHTIPLEYSQQCFERFAQLVKDTAVTGEVVLVSNPPSDENIFDAWVSAGDSDGIAYDGVSFERGYRLGRGDYDEYTGALITAAKEEVWNQVFTPLSQIQVADGFCDHQYDVELINVFNAGVRFAEKSALYWRLIMNINQIAESCGKRVNNLWHFDDIALSIFAAKVRGMSQSTEVLPLSDEVIKAEAEKHQLSTTEDRHWYGDDYTVSVNNIKGATDFAKAIEQLVLHNVGLK